jgi:outer membrane receptor protein involved in Fe transport
LPKAFARPEFYFNIQNLFNQAPPPANGSGSAPGVDVGHIVGDDIVGRYFTLGVRMRL